MKLFSGIDGKELEIFLKQGQILNLKKGKILFLESEQTNYLYIILKGWVKIFKASENGNETILQMLTRGDSIMESAVFLNIVYPASSQLITDVTLFSLPASIFRNQIRNNNRFALNLLTALSRRSQDLIRQMEISKSKTVDERIGRFLLNQLLNQEKISNNITLPYHKSLIASYLDMKRETFSRSLKRMKTEKGFRIKNDTITIPDFRSLCDFCDDDTETYCTFKKTMFCSKLEQLK